MYRQELFGIQSACLSRMPGMYLDRFYQGKGRFVRASHDCGAGFAKPTTSGLTFDAFHHTQSVVHEPAAILERVVLLPSFQV